MYTKKSSFIRASRYNSRRFPMGAQNSVAYLTDAEQADLDKTELMKTINTAVSLLLESRATKDELESVKLSQTEAMSKLPIEQLRAMADDKTGVVAQIALMGLQIEKMKTERGPSEQPDMSIRGQISAWHADNKAKIEEIRSGGRNVNLPELKIRAAASPMTVGTFNPGASAYIGRVEVESGINSALRATPTFWDFLQKGRTNAQTYVWVNMIPPVAMGDAAWIAPGALKPGISFTAQVENSVVKKIAVSLKATMELLNDIDGMATFIAQELQYNLMMKVNSTLMSSVGSSILPTGIRQLSTAYTLTSIKTPNPNYMDAIRAVIAQLRSGFLTGDITVFVNSIDAANMDLTKATSSGTYLLPPFVTADGRTIAGARIIEDNNVAVGSFQAGFMQYYRILIYQDFSVSIGWENDDFTRNLQTYIGEMRMHQFFNTRHNGAFVYTSFAAVILAITPA